VRRNWSLSCICITRSQMIIGIMFIASDNWRWCLSNSHLAVYLLPSDFLAMLTDFWKASVWDASDSNSRDIQQLNWDSGVYSLNCDFGYIIRTRRIRVLILTCLPQVLRAQLYSFLFFSDCHILRHNALTVSQIVSPDRTFFDIWEWIKVCCLRCASFFQMSPQRHSGSDCRRRTDADALL